MEKIGLVVDSTFYFDKAYVQEHDIKVVSLNVIENDTTHKELEIDNDFVFSRMDEKIRLTTSQPSPSEFVEVFEQCFKQGYTKVLVLTLSQGLSGTYQSAVLARNILENPDDVHIFDTKNAAYGNELLAMQVADMIKSGKSVAAIIKRMDDLIENTQMMFSVENLYHMQKGGRLSKTQALLGTVLRVKPVIKIIDGKLALHHKERTHKKLHQYFIDQMLNDPNADPKKTLHVRLIERDSQENLDAVLALIKENFKNPDVSETHYLGPVFSIHVGPKGFGLCWFYE